MDWLDKFLSIGETPDWLSPTDNIIQDMLNGSHRRIYASRNYAVRQLTNVLKSYSIKYWGDCVLDDYVCVTVKEDVAQYACYVLQKEGIDVALGE